MGKTRIYKNPVISSYNSGNNGHRDVHLVYMYISTFLNRTILNKMLNILAIYRNYKF